MNNFDTLDGSWLILLINFIYPFVCSKALQSIDYGNRFIKYGSPKEMCYYNESIKYQLEMFVGSSIHWLWSKVQVYGISHLLNIFHFLRWLGMCRTPHPLSESLLTSIDIWQVEPNANTQIKEPFGCTEEAGKPSTVKWGGTKAATLTVVQEITCLPPPVPTITTSDSARVGDSDDTSEDGAQCGSSTSIRMKWVVSVMPLWYSLRTQPGTGKNIRRYNSFSFSCLVLSFCLEWLFTSSRANASIPWVLINSCSSTY